MTRFIKKKLSASAANPMAVRVHRFVDRKHRGHKSTAASSSRSRRETLSGWGYAKRRSLIA
jgi:hypothetical protein